MFVLQCDVCFYFIASLLHIFHLKTENRENVSSTSEDMFLYRVTWQDMFGVLREFIGLPLLGLWRYPLSDDPTRSSSANFLKFIQAYICSQPRAIYWRLYPSGQARRSIGTVWDIEYFTLAFLLSTHGTNWDASIYLSQTTLKYYSDPINVLPITNNHLIHINKAITALLHTGIG